MWTRYYKKNKLARVIFLVTSFCFIIYFINHAIIGDYGLKATKVLKKSLVERKEFLTNLQEARYKLEFKVKLMRDGSLEKDLLDEKARYNLNLSRGDEIILFYSNF
ncbi:FtsB family cell division protein [Candidatus Liberibacter brunswickensis]|uniref:FtsB family cell division protein n=1 Tax=Candidatus Liberibacter brunswickensis TaxID=1968796 RepID=UPI002FE27233